LSARNVDKLVSDLEEVMEDVRKNPKDEGDMVALYGELQSARTVTSWLIARIIGLGQTNVGPHVIGRLAETYLDVCLE